MRQVWRPKVAPPTVSIKGGKGFDLAQLMARDEAPRDTFKPFWRESDVRGCVRAACGSACAYCGDLIGRTGEDVEHFRPKSAYWFLAYAYSNYLASCRQCNSSRKGDKFELEAGAVAAISRRQLRGERRRLLDPVLDRVEEAMRVVLVNNRYLWEAVPTASPRLRSRAAYTIDFFALNDDGELVKARSTAVAQHLLLTVRGTPQIRAEVRPNASRFVPHGAAIRSILAREGPQHLPSADEELTWLVKHLIEVLAAFNASARPNKGNRELVRYALAALLLSPPPDADAGIPGRVIEAAGVLDEISPLAALLAP